MIKDLIQAAVVGAVMFGPMFVYMMFVMKP